jgi:hypothetical protein
MRPTRIHCAVFTCVFTMSVAPIMADGHGPAFGYSTATLGFGESSIETGLMWRAGVLMFGPRVSFGVKPNFQLSFSAPIHLTHGDHPAGRFESGMPGNPGVEAVGAWRFHHSLTGVGTRNESTLYFGASADTQSLPRADGRPLNRKPGLYVAAATGHVSRRMYVWAGAGYQHYARWSSGDRDEQSDTALGSVVVGWRPFDLDYPRPDFRVFLETTAEHVGSASRDTLSGTGTADTTHSHGTPTELPAPDSNGIVRLPDSGHSGLYTGPSALWTYKGVALQGGVLFKVAGEANGAQAADKYRMMVGASYFFTRGRK